ncbi:MAG: 50S ribosomal protein L24 [Bacteroidia bacterium]|nr:50S ribosomal protein L24 [Bacteroidia bacterium]MCO5254048.1 50S ribosomal protein L24 [Bacteroidota bacterium]MCZ2131483.1 50S ribosomal protein L24 [Bacteroidia bacterium]
MKKNSNIQKIHIKKGDTVKAISGNDKAKPASEVLVVYPKTYRALVKGYNLVTKHVKPTQQKPDGEIIKKEAPIHISNLMVVVGGKPTKVGRKADAEGKLKRYAKKTGEFID